MELSEANLRALFVDLRPAGPAWPYDGGSTQDIAAHLKAAEALLQRSPRMLVSAHPDHYGSGYASYVHLFCYKRKGKSTTRKHGVVDIDGLDVYLSRLAALAAFGAGHQSYFDGGSMSYSNLRVEHVGQAPPGDWTWEMNEVRTKLARHGFVLPLPQELSKKLPFELKARRYRPSYAPECVFDAIFFWDE